MASGLSRAKAARPGFLSRIASAERGALLLGTALASSLIVLPLLTAPAASQVLCTGGTPPPGNDPIAEVRAAPIVCDNVDDRTNPAGNVIDLQTTGVGSYITLDNSGDLTAINNAGDASGIYANPADADSPIVIGNTGAISVTASDSGAGIFANTGDPDSAITVTNSGFIDVTAGDGRALGIFVDADDTGSDISVINSGDMTIVSGDVFAAGIYLNADQDNVFASIVNSGNLSVTSTGDDAFGVSADTDDTDDPLSISNSGILIVDGAVDAYGIFAYTVNATSAISIVNSGAIAATADNYGHGIYAATEGDDSSVRIDNSGAITVEASEAYGIYATVNGLRSDVVVINSGRIGVTANVLGYGIYVHNDGEYDAGAGDGSTVRIENSAAIGVTAVVNAVGIYATSDIQQTGTATSIVNSGALTIVAGIGDGFGIKADVTGENSPIAIENSGAILVTADDEGVGIRADTNYGDSAISIDNSGAISVTAGDDGFGILAYTNDGGSAITIANSGNIGVTGGGAVGIRAQTIGANSSVSIVNSGDIDANGGDYGAGMFVRTAGAGNTASIVNSGAVSGSDVGIYTVFAITTINNLAGGLITAGSGSAINIVSGPSVINNAGTITGFVSLTGDADLFVNQSGGVFNASGTSLFREGDDLFVNQAGAVVNLTGEIDFGAGDDLFTNEAGGLAQAASNGGVAETTSFVGLERFENFGTISLVDGAPGDLFTIANVVGASNLDYEAGSNLNVDAFLGAAGSRSDIFRIDGNVEGVTDVNVNNTNARPGVFNPDGIRVVEVTGDVDDGAFRLANGPIDTGFFNFDLFAEDDGTQTNFELRSFVGAGAFILPQLVTATQDIWHQTSDTWFNRSADLRTALRGGGDVPGVPGAMYLGHGSSKDGPVAQGGLAPAVWAKASAGALDRDDTANTSAFGRSYQFDLDRELYVADFQTGIDFGKRGVLTGGDALLFSVFGGGVFSNLQYDRLQRRFDIDGGQVGVAATYLNGGLFVDALFNAQFLDVEADNFAFPQSFGADTYGFRLDTGYRFQRSRFFFEPLLTLSVAESDLDGFSVGGNTVSFEEETSVRGRVGLRAGTTTTILGVHAEPYVIASYWSELGDGDTQRATLISSGTSFALTDAAEESWTEISFGSNYFLFGSNAVSAFTKTDIVFGDDIDGYNFTGGFRVQW